MKFFVTGAAGFIGDLLCRELAKSGHQVIGLCRNLSNAQHFNGINYKVGDVLDSDSLIRAMADSEYCFHLAAVARQWLPERSTYFDVNVTGTKNVLAAATQQGVKKFVHVSTAGVFSANEDAEWLNEFSPKTTQRKSDYEISKQQAESLVLECAETKRMEAVVVNPTRVFGPGKLSESNAVTKLVRRSIRGGMHFIPRNHHCMGNYVFVNDLINGLILAMERGKSGSQYLMGGDNLSIRQLIEMIDEQCEAKNRIVELPVSLIRIYAHLQLLLAKIFGRQPVLTPQFVDKYLHGSHVSSEMAKRTLGYSQTPMKAAIEQTISWLKTSDLSKLN